MFLLVAYLHNGDVLPGNDAKPNAYLPLSLLHEGNLTFTPEEFPFMFTWTLKGPAGLRSAEVHSWSSRIDGRPAKELLEEGLLKFSGEKYYVVPTASKKGYVSMYGPGAGLAALPVVFFSQFFGSDLTERPRALWYTVKLAASLFVALSAVWVFFAAAAFTERKRALLLAGAYGLGTCAFSVSSQTLWQHAPNTFFLALGAWLFTAPGLSGRRALGAGLAFGAATVCRPPSGLLVVFGAAYLALRARKQLLPFLGGAVPGLGFLAAYNFFFLGSPFAFGQSVRAGEVAGEAGALKTPLWEGALGLVASPSRGLFVYSPFLVLSLAGAVLVWRGARHEKLRPLSVAALALFLFSAKWHNWWGGWSYGYRLVVDVVPLLVLLVPPVLDWLWGRRVLMGVCALLVAWSVGMQWVGAYAYDVVGWNARQVWEVVPAGQTVPTRVFNEKAAQLLVAQGAHLGRSYRMDVDAPEFRNRLWSWTDSPWLYYLQNFSESRRAKKEVMNIWLDNPGN